MLLAVVVAFGLAFLTLGAGMHVANAQHEANVAIVDFAFDPPLFGVPAGATVTWTNTGVRPHTVTAESGAFDSAQLEPGASFSTTLTTEGSYAYFCRIHPEMTGTIVVTAGGEAGAFGPGAAPAMPVVGVGTGTLATEQNGAAALLLGLLAVAFGMAAVRTRVNGG
jgi:plastocyanin